MTRIVALMSTAGWLLAGTQLQAQASPTVSSGTSTGQPNTSATSVAKFDSASSNGIPNEIVVTAQKRSENLQNVGIAIDAFRGGDLAKLGIISVQRLADFTPALRMESPGGPANATFTIRGVGQRDVTDQNEGAVVVFRDGAYVPFLAATTMPLFDMERVEVLKGPQGTLFGRNATGGLIQLISRKPGDHWEGYGIMTVGSYREIGYEGAVGGPITNDLGIRTAFYTRRADGYVHNRTGPDVEALQSYSGRVTLQYKPAGPFSATGIAYVSHYASVIPRGGDQSPLIANANGTIRKPTSAADFQNYCRATFPLAPAFGYPLAPAGSEVHGNCFIAEDGNPYTVSVGHDGRFNHTYYGFTGTANYELSSHLVATSITDYQNFKKTFFSDVSSTGRVGIFDYDSSFHGHNFSEEARLTSSGSNFNWSLGGYYLDIVAPGDVLTGTINNPALLAQFNADFRQKTTSYAAFGQGDYAIFDRLKLTLGARYTHDRKSLVNNGTCTGNPIFGFVPANSVAPGFPAQTLPICTFYQTVVFPNSLQFQGYDGHFSKGSWNGKAQLDWKPTNDILLYAGVTRGTKSGGFNTGAGQFYDVSATQYKGETLTSYEAGFKATLRNLRTTINGAGFHYTYNNYQSYLVVAGFLRVLNVNADVNGAELEISSNPIDPLTLRVGVSYLDAQQKNVPVPSGGTANFVMPNAPKWSLNGLIGYDIPIGASKLNLQVDGAYITKRSSNAIDYEAIRLPSYFRGNARVTFTPIKDFELAVSVNNFTNNHKIYLIRTNDAALTGSSSDIVDRPRWVQGQITYHF